MIACILLTFAVYLHLTQSGSALLIVSVALRSMEPQSIATALSKAALFGPLIVAIAASQGLTEQPTTRLVGAGVSGATVRMISTILFVNAAWTLFL
jgi:ABC-type transporter Mla maintaining outer membrane lipid asymmetry permease subunit MlaE